MESFSSYQKGVGSLREDHPDDSFTVLQGGNRVILIALLIGVSIGIISTQRAAELSFPKLSSRTVSCDACGGLDDDGCLAFLRSAMESLTDSERLPLVKNILSHKYSCSHEYSDDSCLAYLEKQMNALSNEEQLYLLAEKCSSGSMPVDISDSLDSEVSIGESIFGLRDVCNAYTFVVQPPYTVMSGGFEWNKSLAGRGGYLWNQSSYHASQCMAGVLPETQNILYFKENKFVDVTVLSHFMIPHMASNYMSSPFVGLRMKKHEHPNQTAYLGGFCQGHTGLACGLQTNMENSSDHSTVRYRYVIKECSNNGSVKVFRESEAFQDEFALQVGGWYNLNFSAYGKHLECSLQHADGRTVSSFPSFDGVYDKQAGYVTVGDYGAYNHYFKSVKICSDSHPTSAPTYEPSMTYSPTVPTMEPTVNLTIPSAPTQRPSYPAPSTSPPRRCEFPPCFR